MFPSFAVANVSRDQTAELGGQSDPAMPGRDTVHVHWTFTVCSKHSTPIPHVSPLNCLDRYSAGRATAHACLHRLDPSKVGQRRKLRRDVKPEGTTWELPVPNSDHPNTTALTIQSPHRADIQFTSNVRMQVPLIRLQCGVNSYDWGKKGQSSAAARFAAATPSSDLSIQEDRPYAEASSPMPACIPRRPSSIAHC